MKNTFKKTTTTLNFLSNSTKIFCYLQRERRRRHKITKYM